MSEQDPIHELSTRVGQLEKVVAIHDRNHTDLSASITQLTKLIERQHEHLTKNIERQHDRIVSLEGHRQDDRVTDAAAKVKDEQMRSDMSEVKTFMKAMQDNNVVNKVNGMAAGFDRLFWLVITAIVTGGIGLVFLALRGAA